jgi:CubicO group peptidase (beta-lactamase class C family)
MINTSQNLNKSYGYLWWLNGKQSFMLPYSQFVFGGPISPNAPADMYSGVGKNGQIVSVVPSRQLVIVRMGNSPAPDTNDVSMVYVNELWDELNKLFCSPTGMPEPLERSLALYPNPANDAVMIRGAEEDTRISVYDLQGILLKETLGNTFSVRHFSPGIYLVSITLKDGSRSMHRLGIE